ncbi:zinc-dependent peptidase [bacterium]|nr:zinc-dependent peptidase [bacterium]
MKIYKFSRILSILPAIVLGWFFYKMFIDPNFPYIAWAILPAAILALLYLFQPQIDYWWLDKNPIELDPEITLLLQKTNPIYNRLNEEDRAKFHKRIYLYVEGIDFKSKGYERDVDVLFDVKNMIAQVPITMTLNRKHFLFKDFEHIIMYKHAFPSPVFKFLHTVETHSEDGVIVFSLEHAEHAFFSPYQFYNVAYHAYAEAFVKSNPKLDFPTTPNQLWSSVETISGFTKDQILGTLGFEKIDLLYILITIYFTHQDKFRKELPEIIKQLDTIFEEAV